MTFTSTTPDIMAMYYSMNQLLITTPTMMFLQETVMATWKPKSGLNITGRFLFPNTFKDFRNITVKIGVREVGFLSTKLI